MSLLPYNLIWETALGPGTGTVTLLGARTDVPCESTGFNVVGNGNQAVVRISQRSGPTVTSPKWEISKCTFTLSGRTLTRNTVIRSSSGTSAVDFTSAMGTLDVFVVNPALLPFGEGYGWGDGTTNITAASASEIDVKLGSTTIASIADSGLNSGILLPNLGQLSWDDLDTGPTILAAGTPGSYAIECDIGNTVTIWSVSQAGSSTSFGFGADADNKNHSTAIGEGICTADHQIMLGTASETVVHPGPTTLKDDVSVDDAQNFIFGTSTGTKFGTATTQLIGFYNATPVGQIAGNTDILAGLVTVGLRAASSNPPLNMGTGALTAGAGSFTTLAASSTQTFVGNTTLGDGTANSTITLTTSTSGAGKTFTLTGSDAAAASGLAGGDVALGGGAGDGAGAHGRVALATNTTTLTTASTELVMEQTGDTLGTTRLRLQNRSGVNGAIFENVSLDLVDFIFKSSAHQANIRFEGRSGNTVLGTAGEWQIGDPNGPGCFIAPNGIVAVSNGSQIGEFRILAGDDSAQNQNNSSLVGSWATNTHASRKGRCIWNVYDTAIREAIRIESDGSNAGVSLFGQAVVAQMLSLPSATTVAWNADTGLVRVAAGVVGPSDGGATANKWIQNTAGHLMANTSPTNATNTLASTNLAWALIAGRSYSIKGKISGGNSAATEGIQFALTASGGLTATTFDLQVIGTNGTVVAVTTRVTALGAAIDYSTFTTTSDIYFTGEIKVSVAGTMTLQFAESTVHAAGTVTLNAGSWVMVDDCVAV